MFFVYSALMKLKISATAALVKLDQVFITYFIAPFLWKRKWLSWIQSDRSTARYTAWKMSLFGVFLVRIFPHFGYSVSLQIQSKSRKIRTRKTPNTDTFHAVVLKQNDSIVVRIFFYCDSIFNSEMNSLILNSFITFLIWTKRCNIEYILM